MEKELHMALACGMMVVERSQHEKGCGIMEYRIGHLAFGTRDMDKTLQFYVGILGFRHVFSISDDREAPWIEYLMGPDGRFIEFFYTDASAAPLRDEGYMHLCLEVEDCAAAVAELRSKGAPITADVSMGKDGNYQAWTRDPDGRSIEIMQLSPASEQFKYRSSLK